MPFPDPCPDCETTGLVACHGVFGIPEGARPGDPLPERAPWKRWADLPLASSTAVLLGTVAPGVCPSCCGLGYAPAGLAALVRLGDSKALRYVVERLHTHPKVERGSRLDWDPAEEQAWAARVIEQLRNKSGETPPPSGENE